MLQSVLKSVVDDLNSFILNRTGGSEDRAVLFPLNEGEKVSEKSINVIQCQLVGLQEEKTMLNVSNSPHEKPPYYINAYVIFAAKFKPELYADSLRAISMVLAFFKSQNVFEGLADETGQVQRAVFEIHNLDFHQFNGLCSMIGMKYMPSILYKIKLLVIDGEFGQVELPEIEQLNMENPFAPNDIK